MPEEPSHAPPPAPPLLPIGRRLTLLLRRLGPAGPLAVMATAFPPLCGIALFAFMGPISEWLRAHGVPGLILYTAAFAVLAGLALLPTYAQAVLGGFAFGMLLGMPAALIAFTLGAGLGTEIARRATGDRVMQLIAEKPKWLAVRNALVRDREAAASAGHPKVAGRLAFWRTTGLVMLIRFPPNSPFALTNLLLASVQVPRGPLWLGTMLGMAPRTIAAVWIGAHLEKLTSQSDLHAATPRWLAATGIAAGILVLVVVTIIANRALRRATTGTPGQT